MVIGIFTVPNNPMELSDCMAIAPNGVLIYLGHKGEIHEVVGGKNGQINLSKL